MGDDAIKSTDIKRLQKLVRFQPIRFVHIFFSVVLTLYGAGILLAGITVKSELCDYMPFLHYYLDKPVFVLILSSVVLICLGCLGIISASQNLYQGIITFGVLLFGLFMFILTMGAVFLAVLNSADKSVIQALEIHMNNYTEYSDPFDFIQTNLNCCGISDFTDWNSALGYIPGSCCDSDSACGFADVTSLNETGCYEALKNLVDYLINYLIIISAVLAALQITTIVVTFFLARGIADYRRRISECIVPSGETAVPQVMSIPKIQNPLGLKSALVKPPREKDQAYQLNNSAWNGRNPVSNGGVFERQEMQHSDVGVLRENIVRNPSMYREADFSYNKRSREKIVPSVPRLPRAHRKFPVGF